MHIGELSGLTGASVRSIRHYERAGLLAPEREENGYRNFESQDVERVRRIRSFLSCGLNMEDILDLRPCLDRPREADYGCVEAVERYRSKLTEIQSRIDSLEEVKGMLLKHVRASEGSRPSAAQFDNQRMQIERLT